MWKRTMRGSNGFTIVELLVVVAIISLLASLLVPSLQLAREQALLVVCVTNLRGLSYASSMYMQDHSDYWIQDEFPHDMKMKTLNAHLYYLTGGRKLAYGSNLSKVPDVFWCPTAPRSARRGATDRFFYTGYGYYARLDEVSGGSVAAGMERRVVGKEDGHGVLWADTVSYFDLWSPAMWWFTHPQAAPGHIGPFWGGPIDLMKVQHLGMSDGSVETRDGIDEILDGANPHYRGSFWQTASFRVWSWYAWWF